MLVLEVVCSAIHPACRLQLSESSIFLCLSHSFAFRLISGGWAVVFFRQIGYFLNVLRDHRKSWSTVLFVVPAAYVRLWHWTLAVICPTFTIVGYYGERGYLSTVRRTLKAHLSDVATPSSPAHILLCTYQSLVKDNGTIALLRCACFRVFAVSACCPTSTTLQACSCHFPCVDVYRSRVTLLRGDACVE
jgi:hypothetical protein